MREENYETYLGGQQLLRVSKFCEKVTLMSMIGEDKKFYSLLKKKTSKKYRFKTYI